MFFLIEFVLCAVAVLAAFFKPNLGEKWFLKFERPLNRLAQHRGRTVLGEGLLALALRGALLRVELCGPGDRSDLCLLMIAMQNVRRWRWRGQRTGLAIVRAVFLLCFTLILLRAANSVVRIPIAISMPKTWFNPELQRMDRAQVFARL